MIYLSVIFCILIILSILELLLFNSYLKWEQNIRRNNNYFGKSLKQRQMIRQAMSWAKIFFAPAIALESAVRKKRFTTSTQWIPSFNHNGIYFPKLICSPDSVNKAFNYRPQPCDIFIVTQMKSGTTWLQHIVFQILTQGQGEITNKTYGHLQNISPWLEADLGTKVNEAPLLNGWGRIIKTHLPAQACPFSIDARYIYLMRNPLTCLESIINHFQVLSGPLTPPIKTIIQWFCSTQMWWTPWPDHVSGWFHRHERCSNILILSFEDLKKKPKQTMEKIASFLGYSLSSLAWPEIIRKTSLNYMQQHELFFEMSPPNIFTGQGTFFKKGRLAPSTLLNAKEQQQIINFCKKGMQTQGLRLENFYHLE